MRIKGGYRRGTRKKLSKTPRTKGKVKIRDVLQIFNVGDTVKLRAEPAVASGLYHPRFHGKNGIVKGQQGNCFIVTINDQGKKKDLIIHPSHLARFVK